MICGIIPVLPKLGIPYLPQAKKQPLQLHSAQAVAAGNSREEEPSSIQKHFASLITTICSNIFWMI